MDHSSCTTGQRRPRLVPRGWVRTTTWGSEVTGSKARLLSRSHPIALLVCRQTVPVLVAASWEGSVSHEVTTPTLRPFPSKKQGQSRAALGVVSVVVMVVRCTGGCAGAGWLVGRVRTLPLHVVTTSHFHFFPSRRRWISGSPLPDPGWHFSLRGVTSCKVASLFQGFPIARIFPISAPAASHESHRAVSLLLFSSRRHEMLCLLVGDLTAGCLSSGNKNYWLMTSGPTPAVS